MAGYPTDMGHGIPRRGDTHPTGMLSCLNAAFKLSVFLFY